MGIASHRGPLTGFSINWRYFANFFTVWVFTAGTVFRLISRAPSIDPDILYSYIPGFGMDVSIRVFDLFDVFYRKMG